MPRGPLCLLGDPLRRDAHACALRELLAAATAAGFRCALSLSLWRGEAEPRGQCLSLTDGVTPREAWTMLSPAELRPVLEAAQAEVSATAPVVVFGSDDDLERARLERPLATEVLRGDGEPAGALLARLAAPARSAATPAGDFAEFEALPPAPAGGPLLHPGSRDPRDGTDLAVEAAAAAGEALTVLLERTDPPLEQALRAHARGRCVLRFAHGSLTPELLAAHRAVLLPVRAAHRLDVLHRVLASGRPAVVSRFAGTAPLLAARGVCLPLGGRRRSQGFAPDPRALAAALRELRVKAKEMQALAARARRQARAWAQVPAQPRQSGGRPRVVLEAPLFELSSSALLTLETARALWARRRVELALVPVLPFATDLAWLRARYPELVPLLAGRPGPADLWLAAGWPPRPDRPPAARFAVRVDWEYGALPIALTPLVTEEADVAVVHSTAVQRVLAAAGRPAAHTVRIPHGVDGEVFHERGDRDARLLAWKRGRPALLFVGGLIWRKGFDLVLRAALELGRAACLVVKEIGGSTTYAGYHLRPLLDRLRASSKAPDVLLLDEDLTSSQMAALYRACDLLVHPYRGEGFGLPVLEARACGLPVVVTAGGATDDFCDGPGCVRIAAARRPIELEEPCVGQPWVLEPDPGDLLARLRGALEGLPALRAAAASQAAAVRAAHSWAAAAAALERLAAAARYQEPRRPDPAAAEA